MKIGRLAAGLIVLFAAAESPLSAQWPSYPTRGVPRTPDGKPNLEAPAPRTADGKPDFTGLWDNAWFHGGRVAAPPVSPPGEPPASTFGNVGAGFKDGLPLTPWGAEVLKKRKADNSKDNPEAHCLPMGIVQFHTQGAPRKFVQIPDLIVAAQTFDGVDPPLVSH